MTRRAQFAMPADILVGESLKDYFARAKDPLFPSHPDPHAWTWTEAEKRAIKAYGDARALAAQSAPGQETFTLDEIASACVYAEIQASKYESLEIALLAAHRDQKGGV